MHSEDALEHLIQQFSQPLAFLRELIQNSLDASTELIEVQVDYDAESKSCVVRVSDTGEGMNRGIIDSRLTRLFSSTKENDLTKIGKFGIGFVSVFAVRPKLVVVETGRDGESWRLLFKKDRSFERRQLDYPVEGTTVTVFVPRKKNQLTQLQIDCRETITYWCKYSDVEIRFNGQSINQKFEFSGSDYQYRHRIEGTECVMKPSTEAVGFHGYYNRGLTLLEGLGSPLPYLSFILRSRYLEHTLTRDNIRQDRHYRKAMKEVRKAAHTQLPHDLFTRLAKEDSPELWGVARSMALALANQLGPFKRYPIFAAGEERLTLKQLPQTVYYSEQTGDLWSAAESIGATVIQASSGDEKLKFLEQLGYSTAPLEAAFFHYQTHPPEGDEESLMRSLSGYARKLGLAAPILVKTLHCPNAWSRRLSAYLHPKRAAVTCAASKKSWGFKVGLRRRHPLFNQALELHRLEPELAVYLVFRTLSLELELGTDRDARLFNSLARSLRKRTSAP